MFIVMRKKIHLNENYKRKLYEKIMKQFAPIVAKNISESFLDDDIEFENPDVKIGDKIRIIDMKGEPEYAGKIGIVKHIDSIGQIHGTWGGCALQPENDEYEII